MMHHIQALALRVLAHVTPSLEHDPKPGPAAKVRDHMTLS